MITKTMISVYPQLVKSFLKTCVKFLEIFIDSFKYLIYNAIMETKRNDFPDSDLVNFHLPRYGEIPDVGLFLEQTVRLINSYLSPLEGFDLTNSMVSNYVKQKIIAPPVKKLYHREQIARLIFLVVAKSILSLENIQQLFVLQGERYAPEQAYNYFCVEFENTLQFVYGGKGAINPLGGDATDVKQLLKNMIFTVVYKSHLIRHLNSIGEQNPSKS